MSYAHMTIADSDNKKDYTKNTCKCPKYNECKERVIYE